MKNVFKLIGITALVAAIGFSFAACDDGTTSGGGGTGGTGGGSNNLSLNGVWNDRGWIVTINGSTGVMTQMTTSDAVWQSAVSKNYVKAGDQYFRNLTKTGDLTWTGQELAVLSQTSAPNVATGTTWINLTITMNVNGQTFSDGHGKTYTRVNTSLNGVWNDRGWIVTINGSTGVMTQMSTSDPVWQSAVSKGYLKVGDQYFRNLTKTGDLTWTGQELAVLSQTSAPNVATGTTWINLTITMNVNGQTFSGGGKTYTRQ